MEQRGEDCGSVIIKIIVVVVCFIARKSVNIPDLFFFRFFNKEDEREIKKREREKESEIYEYIRG